ncbi:hypothetical protein [Micromonospora sp. HM5-17]|uniref:hypothetical protein n=1 Tax=Micromonospora sp. HM5-17 TaxID=2487710 RepID=UPI001F22E341|nr:hypothetical protein [Micromonospora sp. HM5-17]
MSRSDPARETPTPAEPRGPDVPAPTGSATPTPAVRPGAPGQDAELGTTVAALTDDALDRTRRRRLLGRLVDQVRRRGAGRLRKPRAALRWLTDVVTEVAPHVPVRDRETLRRHFGGLDGDALAERLVRNAARATAGVGAASGGLAAVEWAATPTLLSAPVLLAAETVAVVAIELKLIGELHEAYGVSLPGTTGQRAVVLLRSWAAQRGINPLLPGVGISTVLGTAARTELRDRLLRRFGRNLTTLGPFLTGAAVAAFLNGRTTRGLGDRIREDLRRRRPAIGR